MPWFWKRFKCGQSSNDVKPSRKNYCKLSKSQVIKEKSCDNFTLIDKDFNGFIDDSSVVADLLQLNYTHIQTKNLCSMSNSKNCEVTCSICQKNFCSKSHLILHKQFEKHFSCSFCRNSFGSIKNLETHYIKHCRVIQLYEHPNDNDMITNGSSNGNGCVKETGDGNNNRNENGNLLDNERLLSDKSSDNNSDTFMILSDNSEEYERLL